MKMTDYVNPNESYVEQSPNARPTRYPAMLPPCRICSEKASGCHYGANTCEACKVHIDAE